jgi:hypothetical protein
MVSTATGAPGTGSFVPGFFIEQAYGEIALPGNLTLDVGKFTTTAGAEVIEANKNWLYSRSLLFNAITILHTGVRANLKISDKLTLQGSLVNGWNNDPDQNAWKTGGLSATLTPNQMLSLILTTYFGKESAQGPTGGTPGPIRVLVDFVAALTLNDKLGLNLNVDYIKAPGNATGLDVSDDYFVGAAVMGRYIISDHVNIAARGEWARTHSGGANQDQEEGTFLLGLPVAKNFEFRPEVRYDHINTSFYPMAMGDHKSLFTFEFAALAYF